MNQNELSWAVETGTIMEDFTRSAAPGTNFRYIFLMYHVAHLTNHALMTLSISCVGNYMMVLCSLGFAVLTKKKSNRVNLLRSVSS